jgi:hypothetical protein
VAHREAHRVVPRVQQEPLRVGLRRDRLVEVGIGRAHRPVGRERGHLSHVHHALPRGLRRNFREPTGGTARLVRRGAGPVRERPAVARAVVSQRRSAVPFGRVGPSGRADPRRRPPASDAAVGQSVEARPLHPIGVAHRRRARRVIPLAGPLRGPAIGRAEQHRRAAAAVLGRHPPFGAGEARRHIRSVRRRIAPRVARAPRNIHPPCHRRVARRHGRALATARQARAPYQHHRGEPPRRAPLSPPLPHHVSDYDLSGGR